MGSDWWEYIGPGHIPLLTAISQGRVTREHEAGMFAPYLLDGEPIGTNQVRHLATLAVVEVRLVGPPTITEDGARVLRKWDEEEWWRRRRARYRQRQQRQARWQPWRPGTLTEAAAQAAREGDTGPSPRAIPRPVAQRRTRRPPAVYDSDDF